MSEFAEPSDPNDTKSALELKKLKKEITKLGEEILKTGEDRRWYNRHLVTILSLIGVLGTFSVGVSTYLLGIAQKAGSDAVEKRQETRQELRDSEI
jgi:hypothetical protein